MAGGLTCVWTDDYASMDGALRYLYTLGHRGIARITGAPRLVHIIRGTGAMRAITHDLGIPVEPELLLHSDFSGESGARATCCPLTCAIPPTVII